MGGRTRYIQDPETGELVEASQYQRQKFAKSWQIMPDIAPYTSTIDGSTIGSRSIHRAHLRAHGCIEVGNEKVTQRPIESPPGLKQTIIDLANERLR